MESSTSRTEVMKPLILKAGIPLVLSVAAFVYARIILKKRPLISENPNKVCNSLKYEEVEDDQESYKFDEENMSINSDDVSSSIEINNSEILSFKNEIAKLQKKELELEMKFLKYQVMKEEELVLMELKNMLILEVAHVNFLDKEIGLIESENVRFQNLVMEYFRILDQVEFAKHENRVLRRKMKRVSRKSMEKSRVLRENFLKINEQEDEILICYNGLTTKDNFIKKLEDEIMELKDIVNQLQEEKNELLIRLNDTEISDLTASNSKIGENYVAMEDYNKLVNELEELRKDRTSEITELIYLRWSNACLRHELMRIHEHEHEHEEEKIEEQKEHLEIHEHEDTTNLMKKGKNCLEMVTNNSHSHDHGISRRKKLLHKLKKWVDGNNENVKFKLEDKEKQEINCFGRFSVSEVTEDDQFIHARRSCSSA